MESIWRIYWMHILWVIAAGPDPHMIILETEGLVVVYGISRWQEQAVVTAEHSAHRKRWFIVKRICSKKERKKKDRKRRKGGICLPAAYVGCNYSEWLIRRRRQLRYLEGSWNGLRRGAPCPVLLICFVHPYTSFLIACQSLMCWIHSVAVCRKRFIL